MKLLKTIEQWEKNKNDKQGTVRAYYLTDLEASAPDMAEALKAAVELADSVDVMNEIAGQQALANLMRDLKAFREAMG